MWWGLVWLSCVPNGTTRVDRAADSVASLDTDRPSGHTGLPSGTLSDTGATFPSDTGSDAPTVPAPRACNGASGLCDRAYHQVSVVCSHNAMSNQVDGFTVPTANQKLGFTAQLDAGVRCLMLDTYMWNGEAHLCHGLCGFWGSRPLVDGLTEIADWMHDNPDEVVTFILEAYISEAETLDALGASGLEPWLYHHGPPGTPWPTLGEMLDADERLVVFTDDRAANRDWHLDWDAYGWETPFNDATFTCNDNRGDPATDQGVFILNHYTLCALGGCESNGERNNAYDFLLDRAARCWDDATHNPQRQIPTFLNLDHVQVPLHGADPGRADAFEVAKTLNEAWPDPPNR